MSDLPTIDAKLQALREQWKRADDWTKKKIELQGRALTRAREKAIERLFSSRFQDKLPLDSHE